MLKLWLEDIHGAKVSLDLEKLEEAGPFTRAFINKHHIGAKFFLSGLVYREPFDEEQDVVAIVTYDGTITPRGEKCVEGYLNDFLPRYRHEGYANRPPWAIREWVELPPPAVGILSVFAEHHAGDPLADALLAIDHQLSTDSDLEDIAGASKYQALRRQIRTAMAKKLGYSGYRKG